MFESTILDVGEIKRRKPCSDNLIVSAKMVKNLSTVVLVVSNSSDYNASCLVAVSCCMVRFYHNWPYVNM
jgi:hypothetical protein